MNEEKLQQEEKAGNIKIIPQATITLEELSARIDSLLSKQSLSDMEKNDTMVFIQGLREIKKHRTTAPTNIPKNFLQQFEFYDDGVNRRMYFYVNGVWRYSTLT